MKILFIGNSYTYYNDMPKLFERLARENGTEAACFSVTCGGRRLFEYTETEDDYSRQIDALAAEHRFDRVILQDHSVISLLDFEGFQRGVRQLEEKLRPCAKEFLLYETWGRKTGSETLAEHGWSNESRTQAVSDMSRMLKIMAKELNVPVICLSQLSRANEARQNKRPMLSDLRESGAIEQDADIVLALYRDGYYNKECENPNLAEAIILKNRHGETGTLELMWLPEYTTFAAIEKKYDDDDY